MGVLATPFGLWSDGGQDAVDDLLEKRYPRAYKVAQYYKRLPRQKQRRVKPLLLGAYKKAVKDKTLRSKFDRVHLMETGDRASAKEFRHHVATGLRLTHTGLFGGRPTLPNVRRREVLVRSYRRKR